MFLSVFMWSLCKCNCCLIFELILRNTRSNNKVYNDNKRLGFLSTVNFSD